MRLCVSSNSGRYGRRQGSLVVVLGPVLALLAVARVGQAANVCNETVPASRMVDGIPAYAQCADVQSTSVYSNNGVDTATTSGGAGWIRTQMSGGYQCTELAHRYLYFKWNVQSVPSGNAGFWCDATIPNGLSKSTTPIHGDLIVFAPGSCGADPTTGHVAVIDVVNADATVTVVEQNQAGRRKCQISCAACFLHASANDGATVDGGVAPDAAAGSVDALASADVATLHGDAFEASDRPSVGTGGARGRGGAGGSVGTGGAGGSVGAGGAGGTMTGLAGSAGGAIGAGGAGGWSGVGGAGGEPSSGDATRPANESESSANGCACHVAEPGESGGNRLSAITLAVMAALWLRRRRTRPR
jgi:MYXO-CTERM domain-containing protein